MKQKKSTTPKRSSRSGLSHTKRAIQARRPLHKRILLHPVTVMVLLCAGVLILGTAIRIFAVSYTVTATVSAQIPTQPAVIGAPITQQHFALAQTVVSGSCPPNSYVKLFRNAAFSGVSQCVASAFRIQTSLSDGANQLDAQVYNITDQAGPASAPVTIYYDQTTAVPAAAPTGVPTTMWVSNLDSNGYKNGIITTTSENPTITGWAPPWSMVTVTFHSDPLTCIAQADGTGWWTCTLDRSLPSGLHHVAVAAITAGGQHLSAPEFQINVQASVASLLKSRRSTVASLPLLVRAEYHYRVRTGSRPSDLGITLSGGTGPFTVSTDWGDGTTTTEKRADESSFTVSHTYTTPEGANKDYAVLVRATDAQGQAALMQLSVVAKGAGLTLVASNATADQLLNNMRQWMWVIWPAYTIVVLMAIGYYLGEREEYRHLMAQKQARTVSKPKRAT
ncbi:MAG TPA: hypothetical protein VLH38_05460 [Patescibacteria group bacterium]|nr:hypothetical protein [Patescibacteria group bacterium]